MAREVCLRLNLPLCTFSRVTALPCLPLRLLLQLRRAQQAISIATLQAKQPNHKKVIQPDTRLTAQASSSSGSGGGGSSTRGSSSSFAPAAAGSMDSVRKGSQQVRQPSAWSRMWRQRRALSSLQGHQQRLKRSSPRARGTASAADRWRWQAQADMDRSAIEAGATGADQVTAELEGLLGDLHV